MPGLRDRFRRRRVHDDDDHVRRGGGARRAGYAVRRTLARIVDLITMVVVVLIVLGIVLVVLKANPDNAIVETILDGARYLAKPFDAIFELDKRRTEIAVNWGIAAAVYLLVGRLVSRLLRP